MNYNKVSLFALLGAGLLIAGLLAYQSLPALAQGPEPETSDRMRTITVTGSGQASAVPDVAVARVGVRTDADSAQEALAQNNQQMEGLLSALARQGISRADIQTQSVQLYPRYADTPGQQGRLPELAGYTAANVVQIRVRDLDRLGETLDEAVDAGGNTIEGIFFEISDSSTMYEQALAAAMNDARSKAGILANLAGAELGGVVSISENMLFPFPAGGSRGGEMAADAAIPVEPGTQNVTAALQVTWQLVGGGTIPQTGGTPMGGTPTVTGTPPTPVFITVTPTPRGGGTVSPTPSPGALVTDFEGLVDALDEAGADIEQAGTIRQPFIPVSGQLLEVNGFDVQVFEFQNQAARHGFSVTISETGEQVGSSLPNWISQPNFWAQGRLVVLYVGENRDLISLLSRALGDPITRAPGGQGQQPAAAIEAQRRLAETLGISTGDIKIVSAEQVEWTDACLGLGQANEGCLQVITPGWRVVLEANGQEYAARTDRQGSQVRWES